MASDLHKSCANYIKSTHSSLRKLAKDIGYHEAWKRHCEDLITLQVYAENMKCLATNCWDINASDPAKDAKCRNKWISNVCYDYFFRHNIDKYRCRERKIANDNNILLAEVEYHRNNVIEVLDVGSCYNPLKVIEFMNVLPIDISPADECVMTCDFLNVNLGKESIMDLDNSVQQLQEGHYDAVIFSLLLEYLPSSNQRKECCLKAYRLLKTEGMLILITPDSKHVGANAKLMKNWRYTLSLMGFSRIKYEKLPYLHCMAFRKSLHFNVAERWAKIYKEDYMVNEIHIPQDFQNTETTLKCPIHCNEQEVMEIFQQLPQEYD